MILTPDSNHRNWLFEKIKLNNTVVIKAAKNYRRLNAITLTQNVLM